MFGMPLGSLLMLFAPYAFVIGGAFYLGLRAVRALEKRLSSRRELDALNERTLRVEERLSEMSEQLGRLADSQEFTGKLLAERGTKSERSTA
jgi:hypothetical protein